MNFSPQYLQGICAICINASQIGPLADDSVRDVVVRLVWSVVRHVDDVCVWELSAEVVNLLMQLVNCFLHALVTSMSVFTFHTDIVTLGSSFS